MEVSSRKPASQENELPRLQQRADFLRKSIRRIVEIEGDLKSALWQEIKNRMSSTIKSIDDQLYDFDRLDVAITDRKIYGLLGQKKNAVNVLAIEEFANSKANFESDLSETLDKIDVIKRSGRNGNR